MNKYLITGGSGFIGTNLMDYLLSLEKDVLNADIKPPVIRSHANRWRECDILDKVALKKTFYDYKPTHVVHLAARTDMDGRQIDDYRANTEGTQNILEAIRSSPDVEKVVVASTQFVHQQKGIPTHDQDYAPHTVYGESKVLTEKYTREANLKCVWTIIRPTNIWGPWHPRYPREFWYVLKRGMYFHPGKQPVIRMYGYVGNVVDQILKIFEAPVESVNAKVFYVGDEPINLYDWVNGFSIALTGKSVRVVPRFFVKVLALAGDMLSLANVRFPITSSRYTSMTSDNAIPMIETFQTLGAPRYTLQDGIERTIKWLTEQCPEYFCPNK